MKEEIIQIRICFVKNMALKETVKIDYELFLSFPLQVRNSKII